MDVFNVEKMVDVSCHALINALKVAQGTDRKPARWSVVPIAEKIAMKVKIIVPINKLVWSLIYVCSIKDAGMQRTDFFRVLGYVRLFTCSKEALVLSCKNYVEELRFRTTQSPLADICSPINRFKVQVDVFPSGLCLTGYRMFAWLVLDLVLWTPFATFNVPGLVFRPLTHALINIRLDGPPREYFFLMSVTRAEAASLTLRWSNACKMFVRHFPCSLPSLFLFCGHSVERRFKLYKNK